MIKIENLVHKYTIWKDENIKSEKTVLDGISLDIPSGQFVAILGPNGSGKSTLAKHLNVLLLPNEGTVWIDGKDTHAKERLWEIRSQVGMVFQNPDNQIIGTSVEEDVAFGPENKNIEPEKIRKIVETVLRKVKLWDRRKASPSILSGGQKQRLATADALAGLPACLVLDEPTAMLDPDSRKEVINIVKELNRKEGMTIILITHHTDEVVDADRIVLMKDGKIIGDDIPKKIFADYDSMTGSQELDVICYILVVSVGLSILFNRNASSGGLDIVAKIMNKYLHMELGKAMSLSGMCVALSAALVYDKKTVVLSILGTYFNGIVLDHFIFDHNIKRRVCIITEKEEALRQFIIHELHSGATIYEAIGAYNKEKHNEIITIVDKSEYQKLMAYINREDPKAFITVYNVSHMQYQPKVWE